MWVARQWRVLLDSAPSFPHKDELLGEAGFVPQPLNCRALLSRPSRFYSFGKSFFRQSTPARLSCSEAQWLPRNEWGEQWRWGTASWRPGFAGYLSLPVCGLSAPETQRRRFCYTKDDDSFLAAVSREWSKHFPKIAGPRERNPRGGAGTDGKAADQSRTKQGSGVTCLGPPSGGLNSDLSKDAFSLGPLA